MAQCSRGVTRAFDRISWRQGSVARLRRDEYAQAEEIRHANPQQDMRTHPGLFHAFHLFTPSERDPRDLHMAIWDEFTHEPFLLSPEKPMILASYQSSDDFTASIEPVGGGLPDMPLFLTRAAHVLVP